MIIRIDEQHAKTITFAFTNAEVMELIRTHPQINANMRTLEIEKSVKFDEMQMSINTGATVKRKAEAQNGNASIKKSKKNIPIPGISISWDIKSGQEIELEGEKDANSTSEQGVHCNNDAKDSKRLVFT